MKIVRRLMLILPLALAGCLVKSVNPEYPQEWSRPAANRVGSCPGIAGSYKGAGEANIAFQGVCGSPNSRYPASKNEWSCSQDLGQNLGINHYQGVSSIVEIRQPDEKSLLVKITYEADAAPVEERTLLLGSDYNCDNEGLYFSSTGSVMGNPAATAVGAIVLKGGVTSHTRTFFRNSSGELAMTVKSRSAGWNILFGFSATGTSYVRWLPVQPAERDDGKAP